MAFLPDNNLAYPVLISSPQSVGSGFYLRLHKTLWLVTAKHVLFDRGLELFSKTISLTSATPDLKKKTVLNVDCEVLFASGGLRKHLKSDVAVAACRSN